jgi:hypothetical protein
MRQRKPPPTLHLVIPRALAGCQELRIPGTVVRWERRAGEFNALSVVFDKLCALDQERPLGFLETIENDPPSMPA